MKIAFVSYSLNESEQYLFSILSIKLKEQGYKVVSSYNETDSHFKLVLGSPDLFIGIITSNGDNKNRVTKEWKIARQKHIPTLILAEYSTYLPYKTNVIRFQREMPELAIEQIKRKVKELKQPAKLTVTNNDQMVTWMVGGIAAIVLINLLSEKEKQVHSKV